MPRLYKNKPEFLNFIGDDGGLGTMTAIEDTRGDAVLVRIYNYPGLFNATSEELDLIFPIGTIVTIREPTFVKGMMSQPPTPFLRVDSPSDIDIVYRNNPSPYQRMFTSTSPAGLPDPSTGAKWKARGATEFKNGRWITAAVCYSNCIKLNFEPIISSLNQAELYLRLGWYHNAFHNAKHALDSGQLGDDTTKKAVVRMMKAHYGLGRYSAALETAKPYLDDPIFLEWSKKANERLREEETGQYDWCKLLSEFQGNVKGYRPDIADFIGPVEVRTPESGVRGLFVTRDVKAGELLVRYSDDISILQDPNVLPVSKMFCRPLCSVYNNENKFKGSLELTNVQDGPSHWQAVDEVTYNQSHKLVQKVWDDKYAYALVQSLYGGQSLPKPKPFPPPAMEFPQVGCKKFPNRPAVDIDIDLIQGVIQSNSFAINPWVLLHPLDSLMAKYKSEGIVFGKVLYAWPSLINHSCLGSSAVTFIGDAIAIRASRDIRKGEEVTHSYILSSTPYDEKMYSLILAWGFECTCAMCEEDRKDGEGARKERVAIAAKVEEAKEELHEEGIRNAGALARTATRMKKYCDDMKQTYKSDREGAAHGCKLELVDALHYYACVVMMQGNQARDSSGIALVQRSIEMDFDALMFAGIKVTDRSVKGKIAVTVTSLPIGTSGISTHDKKCLDIVMRIVQRFCRLGDAERVRRWLRAHTWSMSSFTFKTKLNFRIADIFSSFCSAKS